MNDGDWSFRISGRISGAEGVGIGRAPANPPAGYEGTPLHIPALVQGRLPFWAGAGGGLFLQYGNSVVTAFAAFYANISPSQYQGYYNPAIGPSFGQAYITITPEPLGGWRLSWKVGAFVDVYAGPGQWGWGIFGPLLGLRGYGETISGEYDLAPDWRLSFNHGVLANPGVPENFVRGDYDTWSETGVSDVVHHAHAGFTYKNLYSLKLHYASAYGTDERKYLQTFLTTAPHDGRFDEKSWPRDTFAASDDFAALRARRFEGPLHAIDGPLTHQRTHQYTVFPRVADPHALENGNEPRQEFVGHRLVQKESP